LAVHRGALAACTGLDSEKVAQQRADEVGVQYLSIFGFDNESVDGHFWETVVPEQEQVFDFT